MGEIEIKHPKLFSETWDDLPESVKISCRQSAEAQQERLKLFQLSQDKTTYLVCFDNGYAYGQVSALDLYNFQKLKVEYNKICNQREEYAKSLYNSGSTVISGEEKIESLKRYCNSLEPRLDAILKAAQLFTMPFNREIEKIIDETTNQVVKI